MREDNRFEIIERNALGLTKEAIILRDNKTGVLYLFMQSGYGGGLTPLLDKDGNPIVE